MVPYPTELTGGNAYVSVLALSSRFDGRND